MVTVVNNPASGDGDGGGSGLIIGIVLVVLLVIILIFYGLPALRRSSAPQQTSSGVNVQVPDKIDVNVKGNGQQ